jgi:hypothetical protein
MTKNELGHKVDPEKGKDLHRRGSGLDYAVLRTVFFAVGTIPPFNSVLKYIGGAYPKHAVSLQLCNSRTIH